MAFNFSRYFNRDVIRNTAPEYIEQFSKRKVPYIEQYTTANLKYPSDKVLGDLEIEHEVWGVGSRFYKYADKYYGDASLWWIIPWFNQLPLESDYEAGKIVYIPKPLNVVLSFFE